MEDTEYIQVPHAYAAKLNELTEYTNEQPRSIRLYTDYLLAIFPFRERVKNYTLPQIPGFAVEWIIEGYDQTKEEYGKWSAVIGIEKPELHFKCDIDVTDYPYEYPTITISMSKERYELIYMDLSDSEIDKYMKNGERKLMRKLEEFKIVEDNRSVFKKDDETTKKFL